MRRREGPHVQGGATPPLTPSCGGPVGRKWAPVCGGGGGGGSRWFGQGLILKRFEGKKKKNDDKCEIYMSNGGGRMVIKSGWWKMVDGEWWKKVDGERWKMVDGEQWKMVDGERWKMVEEPQEAAKLPHPGWSTLSPGVAPHHSFKQHPSLTYYHYHQQNLNYYYYHIIIIF